MKKVNIFKYAVLAVALTAGFTSCSKDDFEEDTNNSQVVTVGGLRFQIGNYPSEALRATDGKSSNYTVPGFVYTEGKSGWADGDKINVILTCHNGESAMTYDLVLRYNETEGKWSNETGNAVLETSSANVTVDVCAAYASSSSVILNKTEDGTKFDPQLTATCEYFQYEKTGVAANEPIEINFKKDYARIRLNVAPNDDYLFDGFTVQFVDGTFTANGSDKDLQDILISGESIAMRASDEGLFGNAYIYGKWTSGTKIIINDRTFSLPDYIEGKSFAIGLAPVQGPAVEVDADNNTIVLAEYATEEDITMALVTEALNGGTSLTVTGTITDELVYRAILSKFELIADASGNEDMMFDADFSAVTGLTKLTAVAEYGYVATLKLPAGITEVDKGALDAEYIENLYVYDADITTYPKAKKAKASFFNTADCILHLPASAASDFEEGDTEWGDAEWNAIVFDAE